MNKLKLNQFLLIIMVILSSCAKDDEIIMENEIDDCGLVSEFDIHPNNEIYQSILDSFQLAGFPGLSALIYTPENGLWQGASGLSSVEENTSMLYCDVFYAGSVTKMYTVAAAMALYEDGYFDLDDKISNYLSQRLIDSLPNAQEATIIQLMNHTAGMPDIDNDPRYENEILSKLGVLQSAEDQLSYLFDDPPLFTPGQGAEYSSTHTMTLALIMDKVLDGHHSTAITDKIISKLNLGQTYYQNEMSFPSPDKKVNAYVIYEDGERDNINKMATNYLNSVHGDAGVLASAFDYYQFLKHLNEGNIVSNENLELMKTPNWLFDINGDGFGFGLGLFIQKSNNVIYKIGHSGSTIGGNSHVYYYPEKDAYMILLTNTTMLNENLNTLWAESFPASEQSILGKFESLILD